VGWGACRRSQAESQEWRRPGEQGSDSQEPDLARMLNNLGSMYGSRFERTGRLEDLWCQQNPGTRKALVPEKILVSVIIVVNGIDVVVSVDTLMVTRAVEAEAVTVTVDVGIG
jgi:hypothetical protein